MPGDCGSGSHGGADQVRPASSALTALEISIRGRRAALARLQDIGVHSQAHAAPGFAPLEAGLLEDNVKSFSFGLPLDALRARHHHGSDGRRHLASVNHARRLAQVLNSAVCAGADEHPVERNLLDRRAGRSSPCIQAPGSRRLSAPSRPARQRDREQRRLRR